MTGSIGARRHPITLMGEERSFGAGGKPLATSPIIADVWAEVDDSFSRKGYGEGERMVSTARFTIAFAPAYLKARQLEWAGSRYRIDSLKALGLDRRTIEISATVLAR